MKIIKPQKLNDGDVIGFISPSYVMKQDEVEKPIKTLSDLGFKIKLSKHFFSETNGFSGTALERAEDLNTMIADNEVKMLLFTGGEVCNEILPYVDYESIRQNPKIICSFSDSTTLLDAVYYRSGLVTFYGASIRTFDVLAEYNKYSFINRLMSTNTIYEKRNEWRTICSGTASGILIGGYLVNFATLQNSRYFNINKNEKYILFIEDHESFSSPSAVSKWFSHLEQCEIFDNITGLIFGYYSNSEQPLIDNILSRVGTRHNIPVVCCKDFGHGYNNSIFPIGINAKLDADSLSFEFMESGVVD